MASRKTETPAPAAQAPAAVPMTTIGGFNVSIIGFIPIDAKDLRKQAEIPMLLLDIQEGKKDISALAPFLKQPEFRQQHVRKRFTVAEANALFSTGPDLTAEDLKDDPEPEPEDDRDEDAEDLQALADRDRED